MAGGAQKGEVYTPAYASENLYNHDLAPLKDRFWGWYQVFCMWMADVHSVGGYLFAASLFALGLAGWQVLICLLVGIVIVMYLTNWVAEPGRGTRGALSGGLPALVRRLRRQHRRHHPRPDRGRLVRHPDLCRLEGADRRGAQVLLPQYAVYEQVYFLGLSYLGWFAFLTMWICQFLVFYRGMKAITVFIDWAGPGVYAVMFLLMVWIDLQGRLEQHQLHLGRS